MTAVFAGESGRELDVNERVSVGRPVGDQLGDTPLLRVAATKATRASPGGPPPTPKSPCHIRSSSAGSDEAAPPCSTTAPRGRNPMCAITGESAIAGTYLATMPRAVASERTSLTRASFPYPNEFTSFASGRRGLAGRSLGGQERAPFVPAPLLPD